MSGHLTDEQLSLLVDGELSLVHRGAITAHIASCPECAARHDHLVDVIASLRLQPKLQWTSADTARTMAALPVPVPARSREWPMLAAAAAGTAVAGVLALKLTLVQALEALVRSLLQVVDAFAPAAISVSSASTLLILLAVAVLGPLLAYPLIKDR